MKITKTQFKQIIKEELMMALSAQLLEADQGGDVLSISGTELQTMQYVAKQNGNKDGILGILHKVIMNLGAANKNPKMVPIIKAFRKTMEADISSLAKRVNIDIAEGIDWDFVDLLIEAAARGVKKDRTSKVGKRAGETAAGRLPSEPWSGSGPRPEPGAKDPAGSLGKRTVRAKKGQARQRGGAMVYFKSSGGRSPLIVRRLEKALNTALLTGVDQKMLSRAIPDVLSTIKDEKEKIQYKKQYMKLLQTDPEKRISTYKSGVKELTAAIAAMATEAAATAVAGDDIVLPEPETPEPETPEEAAKEAGMDPLKYIRKRALKSKGVGPAGQQKLIRRRIAGKGSGRSQRKSDWLSKLQGMFKGAGGGLGKT